MNREKIAWTVSLLLIALLAFQLPGSLVRRDDDYSFVRTLVDIHRQVANNYVEPVDESALRQGAINGMLNQLDPFSIYIPPAKEEDFDRMLEGSFKGVGIQLNQTDNGAVEVVSPIDGSPAFKAGMQAGDIILKVNGEGLDGLRLTEVIKRISGKLGTDVTLRVRHVGGQEVDLTMKREEVSMPTVRAYRRKADNTWDWFISDKPRIAYVRITQFTLETSDKLRQTLTELLQQDMKGLILDLRFNPGGHLDQAEKVVNLFIDHGVIVSTRGRNRPEEVRRAVATGTLPYFPLIVLVNEHSASASEIVAGSLMDNRRALVIGQRTYGKGSVQEVVPLEDKGGKLKLTVAHYYLPSGRLVHRKKGATDWGVQPQIVVPMDTAAQQRLAKDSYMRELFHRPTTVPATAQAISASADVQLQRAIDTMAGLVILNAGHDGEVVAVPATLPATMPVSAPAPQ